MDSPTQIHSGKTSAAPIAKRSIAELLGPLNRLGRTSANVIAKPAGGFHLRGQNYELPRFVFLGPKAGDEPIRIGLFAAVHGHEKEGAHALVQFFTWLDQNPELATGYCLFAYPVCNPTGFEDGTRYSRRGPRSEPRVLEQLERTRGPFAPARDLPSRPCWPSSVNTAN